MNDINSYYYKNIAAFKKY